MGFKESAFLGGILGWASLGYIFGNILSVDKETNDQVYVLSAFGAVISLILIYLGIDPLISKLIFCLSIVVFLISFDCDRISLSVSEYFSVIEKR